MRLTREELLNKHPIWNESKHDIVAIMYGDEPLVHYDKNHHIACNNKDKGPNVMKVCKVSCIACGICEKNCPTKAISILDNIPIIDYSKCSNCGTCAEKCPRNLITK